MEDMIAEKSFTSGGLGSLRPGDLFRVTAVRAGMMERRGLAKRRNPVPVGPKENKMAQGPEEAKDESKSVSEGVVKFSFRCSDCDRTFSTRQGLKVHQRSCKEKK